MAVDALSPASRAYRAFVSRVLLGCAVLRYRSAKLFGRLPSFSDIADVHASDKGDLHGYGLWPYRGHGYGQIYETLFDDLRMDVRSILEIGIGIEGPGALGATVFGRNRGGASLKTWSDYFPNARVYGVDLNAASFLDSDRITTFVGDQSSREDLARIAGRIDGPLDVIVDDGSHASRHQQVTLGQLFPHLKPGGIYVIEDLHWQPASLEREHDIKTIALLLDWQRTRIFASPALTETENAFITNNLRETSILRTRRTGSQVAVMRRCA